MLCSTYTLGTPTIDCQSGAPFTLTSGPEADTPEFTLSCSSSGGPVSGFSCTIPGGGTVTGTAGLRDPNSGGDRNAANYDLNVTVTLDEPGTYMYTCQATVNMFDGMGVEPEMLTYPSSPVTRTSKCINQYMSQV